MYIKVQFLNGFSQRLTYKVPAHFSVTKGSLVLVPLRKRFELALVDHLFSQLPADTSFVIKEISSLPALPADEYYQTFIDALASYHALDPIVFYQRLAHFLAAKEEIDELKVFEKLEANISQLTDEQTIVVDHVKKDIENPHFQPTLLQGVTGSGKTEVYKHLIAAAFAQQKSALFLVPEVSLAVRFTHIFKAYFPEQHIFSFHSATSVKEKRALWQHLIENNKPALIIGVHQPIMIPIPQLGLIIIDEEHDHNFQEKRHPKINTKEAALLRAQITKIPILLGSATPSLSSLYNVDTKQWQYFQIKKRFAGAFPIIKTVQLNNKNKRPHFWISKELHAAINDRLQKKEQTIIFINRRGFHFFMQCKECSFIIACAACSVSLTLHEDGSARCHYCGHTQNTPTHCHSCKAPEKSLLKKGIGTQQVVAIVQKLFPTARIARADLDTTINKKKWQATIDAFGRGEFDIMVGTQTITKGYHFPQVTLVGVIWADLHLALPVYHAAEVTVQQLLQVAGRAGRQHQESLVIIQMMVDHPLFSLLDETRYAQFYAYEMKYRKELHYPPYVRFAEIEIRHENETIVEKDAAHCAELIKKYDATGKLTRLGPARPPIYKIKNIYCQKIYLKSISARYLAQTFSWLKNQKFTAHLLFTQNPL